MKTLVWRRAQHKSECLWLLTGRVEGTNQLLQEPMPCVTMEGESKNAPAQQQNIIMAEN
jgi:hypothetical protein